MSKELLSTTAALMGNHEAFLIVFRVIQVKLV